MKIFKAESQHVVLCILKLTGDACLWPWVLELESFATMPAYAELNIF